MGGVLTAFVGAASSAILDPAARGSLDAATREATAAALSSGLTITYWLILAAAVTAFVIALRAMPDVALGHELETASAEPAA